MNRSDWQKTANQLDLDMFRLARRLRDFGEHNENWSIVASANRLQATRHQVQKYMHKKDLQKIEQ